MMTPSHLLMTAGILQASRSSKGFRAAALWGSIAPDIPLYLLSFGGFSYFQHFVGLSPRVAGRHMYSTLFYQDPGWIITHNMLHAPLILAALLFVLWLSRRKHGEMMRCKMTWFLGAAAFHCLVDIFTHVDDGPLIWFPFDWHTRFAAPVSYWDTRYHGATFATFEWVFDIALVVYLLAPRVLKMFSSKQTPDVNITNITESTPNTEIPLSSSGNGE